MNKYTTSEYTIYAFYIMDRYTTSQYGVQYASTHSQYTMYLYTILVHNVQIDYIPAYCTPVYILYTFLWSHYTRSR